eukprot:gene2894-4737_t
MKQIIILLISLFIITQAYQDKIHLSQIQALTFHKGRYTTSKRSAPVMQLKRVGGNVKTDYEPDTVQCKNQGFDGMTVQWKCEADMDEKYRFGPVEVVCEGYKHPGDQNVLVGSCGLEYSLEYTAKGKTHERKKSKSHSGYHQNHHHQRHRYEHVDTSSSAKSIFIFIFLLIIFIIIVVVCCLPSSTNTTTRPSPVNPSYTTSTNTNFYPNVQPTHHTTIIDNSGAGYFDGFIDGSSMSNRRGYYNNDTYSTSNNYYNQESSAPTYDSDSSDDDSTTRNATGFGGTRTR